MILVMAGTREGREVFSFCRQRGYPVLATVATPCGELALSGQNGRPAGEGQLGVACARLNVREMAELIKSRGAVAVVDATHPYAAKASATARSACRQAGVLYIRFARPPAKFPSSHLIHRCPDYARAAEQAASLAAGGKTIFLTTGSKTVNIFAAEAQKTGARVVARVLPVPESLEACLAAGLSPKDLVAVWGPLDYGANRELFRYFGASVVVTKDSGPAGGTEEKVGAALDLGIAVVVVERPSEDGGEGLVVESLEELEDVLAKLF